MLDVIDNLISMKANAKVAKELLLKVDFDIKDWKKLSAALECVDRINHLLDGMLNSIETEKRVLENMENIKKYQNEPYVPKYIGSLWDENYNIVEEGI